MIKENRNIVFKSSPFLEGYLYILHIWEFNTGANLKKRDIKYIATQFQCFFFLNLSKKNLPEKG